MTSESRPDPIKGAMERIAKRKPGRRYLRYDKTRRAIVSVCNPIVCREPHEKIELEAHDLEEVF